MSLSIDHSDIFPTRRSPNKIALCLYGDMILLECVFLTGKNIFYFNCYGAMLTVVCFLDTIMILSELKCRQIIVSIILFVERKS